MMDVTVENRPQTSVLEYATAHPRKPMKMPLPDGKAPALPPRRNLPEPPPQQDEYEEPMLPPYPARKSHDKAQELYDDFEQGTDEEDDRERGKRMLPVPMDDEQQTYDDFDVDSPANNYEFDGDEGMRPPPPLPSLPERPKKPTFQIPQDEYSAAEDPETYAIASDEDEPPPPPPPDLKQRKKVPKPISKPPEKKITPPGVGIIDLKALTAARGGLKTVSKVKTEKKEENKIEKVTLKPDNDTKPESKPLPPTKPTKMNIFKNFMLSKPKDQQPSLPPLPPLPPSLSKHPTVDSNTASNNSHSDDSAEDSSKLEDDFPMQAEDEELYQDAESLTDPLDKYPWYHGGADRADASAKVQKIGKDGTFLVRKSDKHADQPYALVLFYKNRIRHLKIRHRPDGTYALGEQKGNEATFKSVEALVEHHKKIDVILIGDFSGSVPLKTTPPKFS